MIRIVAVAALLAWPGVETYRLAVAKQQLSASQEQQKSVFLRLAQAKSTQMAGKSTQP